jgi:hypothetical protein
MKIHQMRKNCANAILNLGILAFVVCIMSVFPFSAQAGPILEIDETTYSAGDVYAGEVIEHRFIIANAGDAPLEVQRVRSS